MVVQNTTKKHKNIKKGVKTKKEQKQLKSYKELFGHACRLTLIDCFLKNKHVRIISKCYVQLYYC